MVARKQSRWSVETIFRDTKQYAALGACQCFTDAAMVRHVALVLLAFVVLQQLRHDPSESIAAVKERWQLTITRQGQPPPIPLKACPPHLRTTAQVLSLRLVSGLVRSHPSPGIETSGPARRALTDEYERLPAVNHGSRDIGPDLAVRPLSRVGPRSRPCLPSS